MSKRYAISIGINDYLKATQLDYCAKDANDISNVFINFCNVDYNNTRIITSEKTKPNSNPWLTFCETIERLKSEFNQNVDDIFFFFSGHGSRATETTVLFRNELKTISEIIAKIDELLPKTKILIFDSCFSGKGVVESNKSAHFFSESSKHTFGHYILCSCTENQTAKESKSLQNGKFTHFFIATISDLESYNEYGQLDVNNLFSKIDIFFKSYPEFKQNPFQQIKSIGSYPIANNFNTDNFYTRYEISDPNNYDWSPVVNSLNIYLNTKEYVIGEFLRLIRELSDNSFSESKGNASIQTIEITKNQVILIDDGNVFNIFSPSQEINKGGGLKTAEEFLKLFGNYFNVNYDFSNNLNNYTFQFKELSISELCKINVEWKNIYRLNKNELRIDEKCEFFTVRFEKYVIMHSIIHISIEHFHREAIRTQKIIFMEFHEDERLKTEVEMFIEMNGAEDWIKTKTYKD